MGRHKKIKPHDIERTPLEFLFNTKEDNSTVDDNLLGKSQLEHIDDVFLDVQDCRILWTKVIEKAIEDFVLYSCMDEDKLSEEQKFNLWSAKEFIFNDKYTIDAGGVELTLEEVTESLSSEVYSVSTLRRLVLQKLEKAKLKRKKIKELDETTL